MASIVIISPRDDSPPLETTTLRARMTVFGVLSVATHLEKHGHRVKIFCEMTGSKIDYRQVAEADYVAFSFLSYCAPRAYKIAERVKREFGQPIIMGGSHPSVLPEDALRYADYVVRNEGENTMLELINILESGDDPSQILGLSYKDADGVCVHNQSRPFDVDLSVKINLDLAPDYRSKGYLWSMRDAFRNAMPRVPMPVIQTSRGCTGSCKFCVVKYQLGREYRKRPMETVLAEIEDYFRLFNTPYFIFVDNDFSIDPDYSADLFEEILKRWGSKLRPYVFTRIQVHQHKRFLETLSKFEHATLGIGIESLQNDTLREMNKPQDQGDIFEGIDELLKYKLNINGLFIFGSENDTLERIEKTIDYCVEKKFFSVGLFAMYDFPTRTSLLGQPQMIPDHLFIHRDWRFYNLSFVVHFPKNIRPSELQAAIFKGYRSFNDRSANNMYQFFPTELTSNQYIKYLRRIEAPYYDSAGVRMDEKLAGRTIEDLAYHVPITVPRWRVYLETLNFFYRNFFRPVSWRLLLGMLLPGSSKSQTSDRRP